MLPYPNPAASGSIAKLSLLLGALSSTTLMLSSLLVILGGFA